MKIAFFGAFGRPVTGDTLEQTGCGGSETALIHMALELHKSGNEVFVFNRCGDRHGNYSGVEYKDITELSAFLSAGNKFDIFVAFRDLEILKIIGRNAAAFGLKKVVYWAHDDLSYLWNDQPRREDIGSRLKEFTDAIFAVSRWQKSIYQEKLGLPAEKIYVTRNGVDLDYYKEEVKKEAGRLIYSSVPDRGLDLLVELLPKIREQIGSASLEAFTSFTVYGTDTDAKLAELFQSAKQAGINFHPAKTQRELAKEMGKSCLLLYPNHQASLHPVFGETSCITVLEAQAAGTPVITSDRGALSESVLDGQTGILIKGDPYSAEYKSEFIRQTVGLLKDKERWQKMSRQARERMFKEYGWPLIAKEWQAEFTRLIG
ncbi:MAG: glycosyltransferase family 4 protein [Candidatus Saganbacteria bacterium]|nr:glycosyltransferase family 4 protein [Candidatus Saganbacteria bacterium]